MPEKTRSLVAVSGGEVITTRRVYRCGTRIGEVRDRSRCDNRPVRVALLGLGTVGAAVARRLTDETWRQEVAARGLTAPELVAVAVRDPDRDRGLSLPKSVHRSDELAAAVSRMDVDVV